MPAPAETPEPAVTLTAAEWRALVTITRALARKIGEDTMGALLWSSGHTILTDQGIVDLARKIDATV